MQGDSWEAARGLHPFILLEVVIHQGPEVVAAATEEGLGEAGLRKGEGWGLRKGVGKGQKLAQGFRQGLGNWGGGDGTLWQRKLQPSTWKQTSGQVLNPLGQGKGNSPRSPWRMGEKMPLKQLEKGKVASLSQEPTLA